jgi:uncharacterized membrane protein (UPF0127 family)
MEKIKIGEKEYKVSIAKTEEEHEKGLQNITNLPENEGMLFVFKEPDHIDFWMKDTEIPLDIIFLDEDLKVISVKQGEPNSEEYISEDNVQYVLEVNINSGVKSGDELEFLGEVKEMYMLDSKGNVQMVLEGGERIFSRPTTLVLIKKAKKANSLKTDSTYKALGKYAINEINAQDERKPEYV